MIYLDNAATSLPKPPEVISAITDALLSFGNPSRGAHKPSIDALRCMTEARIEAANLFCAESPMNVAFTMNATSALNIAIGGIKGHIVTTAAEHNSVLRPLYRRDNFSVVPLDQLGRLDPQDIENAIQKTTEAVVMTHASNVTGNVFDLERVGEICKKKGLKFIVDGAQTAGLINIDITRMNISALAVSGHKSLYGPQGTGIICTSSNYSPPPAFVGGSGYNSFSTTHPTEMPDALEAGTQNAVGIAGLLSGMRYIKSQGAKVFTAADQLAREFIERAKANKNLILYGDLDAQIRTPVVSLNVKGLDSAFVASQLYEKYGICVRSGAHCAPLMHKTLGLNGAVRFSFSHFNQRKEIEIAINALKEISTQS